jgi:uncharacterized protein
MAAHQFHGGEIGVQTRVGVASTGARVARGIGDRLSDRALDFLNDQRLAVVAGTDAQGALWASALRGEPGFLRGLGGGALEIATGFPPGDPLERVFALPAPVGALVIDLAERRRLRVNGTAQLKDDVLLVTPSEVFFNCPKYIHPREPPPLAPAGPRRVGTALEPAQREWIARADTFFIATAHAERGPDASHRGGEPGFVRVLDAHHLVFPDFSGNAMFQTLGNLAVDARAGLLFVDFASGATLQLSGRAEILWEPERRVRFAVERWVERPAAAGA